MHIFVYLFYIEYLYAYTECKTWCIVLYLHNTVCNALLILYYNQTVKDNSYKIYLKVKGIQKNLQVQVNRMKRKLFLKHVFLVKYSS